MVARPPATYWTTVSSIPAQGFPTPSIGGNLHIVGIVFSGGGLFRSVPADAPSGQQGQTVDLTVAPGQFWGVKPTSIDAATTALPFVILYSPLREV